LIQRRLNDPFFELGWLSDEGVSTDAFSKLMRELVPCDVRQQRKPTDEVIENADADIEFMRDALYTFGAAESPDDEHSGSTSISAHHAQLHMLFAHLGGTSFLPSTSASARCPFYTTCPHEQRQSNSQICRTTPWLSFASGETQCSYGAAVASTLGTVRLRKRSVDV